MVGVMDNHLVPAIFAENLYPEINPVLKIRGDRKKLIRKKSLNCSQKQ